MLVAILFIATGLTMLFSKRVEWTLKVPLVSLYLILLASSIYQTKQAEIADSPGMNGGSGVFGIWWPEVFAFQLIVIAGYQAVLYFQYWRTPRGNTSRKS